MSAEMFTALARGGGGPAAIRALTEARRSRTMLLVHSVVSLAAQVRHPDAGVARSAFEALGSVPRDAVRAVLDYPRVGAWALRTTALLDAGAEAAPGQLAAVLAAARARAGVEGTVTLPCSPRVVLPSLGTLLGSSGPVRVVTSPDGSVVADNHGAVPISASDSVRWRPVRGLCAAHRGVRLALTIDGLGHHQLPDEVVVHDRLMAEHLWRDRISSGWRILVSHHPSVAEEAAAALTMLTPLTSPEIGHFSATLANSFGCVAMSLPDDAHCAALTLAHELQHTKLSALCDLFPLVDTESTVLLRTPWRPDLRPPSAALQGAYAHLAVSAFWRAHDEREFLRWRSATLQTVDALASCGALTSTGAEFVEHMRAVLSSWCA